MKVVVSADSGEVLYSHDTNKTGTVVAPVAEARAVRTALIDATYLLGWGEALERVTTWFPNEEKPSP